MSQLRPALVLLALFTALTGGLYPAVVTAAAQLLFPFQANGSLLKRGDIIQGSSLIGQAFQDPRHFWGRPSATAPLPYNAAASSGSNLGPTNPALLATLAQRVAALEAADPENRALVPVDLVTASASGLDPHISPAAAAYQAGRVARRNRLPREQVMALVETYTEGRALSLLGERRVNVLALNLALDALTKQGPR
jgi:K+-transporting ATPase ATPase C chain